MTTPSTPWALDSTRTSAVARGYETTSARVSKRTPQPATRSEAKRGMEKERIRSSDRATALRIHPRRITSQRARPAPMVTAPATATVHSAAIDHTIIQSIPPTKTIGVTG